MNSEKIPIEPENPIISQGSPSEDKPSSPIKYNIKLIEPSPKTSDLDLDNIYPPPSSRGSINEEENYKSFNIKQMKEILMSKLSAIAQEVVISGRNTESPAGTMLKSLDDNCVIFAVNGEPEENNLTPPEKSNSLSHSHVFSYVFQ